MTESDNHSSLLQYGANLELVSSFMISGPWANVIKLFTAKIYEFLY